MASEKKSDAQVLLELVQGQLERHNTRSEKEEDTMIGTEKASTNDSTATTTLPKNPENDQQKEPKIPAQPLYPILNCGCLNSRELPTTAGHVDIGYVPYITNQFNSLSDIGLYGAAYQAVEVNDTSPIFHTTRQNPL
ncbi:hypothetical protein TSTA_015240 [Talaromyces stipitatus ATCC 10500]|uniref:Uncharacterized protein n=1 Tax=Talaromyces stipitatus (strain ATCC 10500 / CBS 375.48 / QM 6759 / NRRL 1006) TaxID=441959 RepID=B8MHV6_TALSN|nr:uncharacterized protein TSTA_015240 [Talaromyces stipitatus ATCC 10500]EED16436.1 hypothetical protein TSTA_015240 [Talaromyces stipitatus ATCC 10500]